MKFRDLTADDIECRAQSVKPTGLVLLLYKNARVDMNILDETVGAENWQREHYECKGNLFCRVGININYANDNLGDKWIYKSDCGTESNTEPQKGEASDAFKRACFNWGIGRELYSAPFIWIPAERCNIKQSGNKYICNDKFRVEKITYDDDGNIDGLSIMNDTAKVRAFVQTPKNNKKKEGTKNNG